MPKGSRSALSRRDEKLRHSLRFWRRSLSLRNYRLRPVHIVVALVLLYMIVFRGRTSRGEDRPPKDTGKPQDTDSGIPEIPEDFSKPMYSTPRHPQFVKLCNVEGHCTKWASGTYQSHELEPYSLHQGISNVEVPVGYTVELRNTEERLLRIYHGTETCKIPSICNDVEALTIKLELALALSQIKTMAEMSDSKEFIYVYPPQIPADAHAVTLISQFTVNRLERFERTLSAWHGPVSVAIYLTDVQDVHKLVLYFNEAENVQRYHQTMITIVKPRYSRNKSQAQHRLQYPINKLRNLAMNSATTDFVFVIDADFVPSPQLASQGMRDAVDTIHMQEQRARRPLAVVVPCIALSGANYLSSTAELPQNIDELRALYHEGKAYITDWRGGHGPTGTHIFLGRYSPRKPSDSLLLQTYEVCYESQWEPYYVIRKPAPVDHKDNKDYDNYQPPLYDERFRNQGGDKQSHALHLNAQGYAFRAIREHFLMHLDHGQSLPLGDTSSDAFAWPGGKTLSELQKLETRYTYFGNYVDEMRSRYGHNVRWPRGCSDPFGRLESKDLLGAAARGAF